MKSLIALKRWQIQRVLLWLTLSDIHTRCAAWRGTLGDCPGVPDQRKTEQFQREKHSTVLEKVFLPWLMWKTRRKSKLLVCLALHCSELREN